MSNHIENQIKERIVTFVHELDVLVRRSTLEALKSVLDGGSSTPGRRGPGRPRGSGSNAVGGNVASAIVEHVRGHDGQTVGEIAVAVRAAPKLVKKAIIQLLGTGALKKTGQKRGTRYHLGSGTPAPAAVKKGKRGKRKGKRARKAKAA